jgi:hypothetical protein
LRCSHGYSKRARPAQKLIITEASKSRRDEETYWTGAEPYFGLLEHLLISKSTRVVSGVYHKMTYNAVVRSSDQLSVVIGTDGCTSSEPYSLIIIRKVGK